MTLKTQQISTSSFLILTFAEKYNMTYNDRLTTKPHDKRSDFIFLLFINCLFYLLWNIPISLVYDVCILVLYMRTKSIYQKIQN